MHLSLFPLSNDLFLFTLCVLILYHVYTEFINPKPRSFSKKKKYSKIPLKARPLLFPPVYYGSISQTLLHLDINAINKSTPPNIILTDENATEKTENRVKIVRKRESVSISPQRRPSTKVESSPQTENLDLEICARITYPFMPGCEPTGEHANLLAQKFPQLSRPDIVRFLVARKGNVRASEEMIEKYLSWRNIHFPLKKKDIRAALMTKCFFPYGVSKDGSPVVYMRGGLYDVNKASPEEFVMAAAYTIDWSLAQYPEQVNVTVLVHTVNIPGGPNQGADTNFIKLFIQVLSDNYPERLKRLAIFPFPWYGRAIWGVLKVFVDKRTQDKVILLSNASGTSVPKELREFMDPQQMPEFVGGTCKEPIVDLLETLED